MKKLAIILGACGLLLLIPTLAPSGDGHRELISAKANALPVLRHSPDLVIRLPNGKQMLLSSVQGKVVALMFIHTTCPICQEASQVFTKLYSEYGASGFLPVDVAFNSMADVYVPEFVRLFDVRYPVGSASLEEVAEYLNIPAGQRFTIPQIVWIDANGDIRAQEPLREDVMLLTESSWRSMIETLLTDSVKD